MKFQAVTILRSTYSGAWQ